MSTLLGTQPAPQAPIPRAPEVKAYLYQNAVMAETRRFRMLDRYEAHYACLQYAHLQHDWWGLNADAMETISSEIQVPFGFTQPVMDLMVRSKRPTAPYNLCKAVVDRFTGLLFSENRKPEVTAEGDPETEDFLQAAMEQMRFWPKMRQARTMGGAVGSVLVTAHLRDGRFCLEIHNPKHIQVVWKDRRTLTPLAVLKVYRYPVEELAYNEKGEAAGTKIVQYLYRRIITEVDDTVYKPVRLDGQEQATWEVESSASHSLGFFPGVWIQNLPVLDSEDGNPDCHGAWQNFDTLDRLLSQMNKAVLLNLDPSLVIGVDPKVVEAMGGSVRKGSDHALYVGQGGNANYLEISGSGVNAGMTVYGTLKQNTLDVVRCVLVDPTQVSGAAQSAKAIEYIYAPMLEKADDLRAQYGDLGIVPLIQIVERMARAYSGKTVALGNGKIGRFAFDLPPRIVAGQPVPRVLGTGGGRVHVKWGPYFAPTEQDKSAAINNIVAAKGGGLLDGETAVKEAAPIFGIKDPETVYAKVKEEQAAELEQALGGLGPMPPLDTGLPPAEEEPVSPPAGQGGKP